MARRRYAAPLASPFAPLNLQNDGRIDLRGARALRSRRVSRGSLKASLAGFLFSGEREVFRNLSSGAPLPTSSNPRFCAGLPENPQAHFQTTRKGGCLFTLRPRSPYFGVTESPLISITPALIALLNCCNKSHQGISRLGVANPAAAGSWIRPASLDDLIKLEPIPGAQSPLKATFSIDEDLSAATRSDAAIHQALPVIHIARAEGVQCPVENSRSAADCDANQ